MLLRSITSLAPLSGLTRELGLYAAVALIVPGGSLIALALWIFRNRESLAARIRDALSRLAAGSIPTEAHVAVPSNS